MGETVVFQSERVKQLRRGEVKPERSHCVQKLLFLTAGLSVCESH